MDSEVCYSNAAAYAGSVDDGDDDDDDNECCVNAAAHGRRSLHEGKHEQTVEHLMGYMTLSSSTNTTTHRHHNHASHHQLCHGQQSELHGMQHEI